MRALAAGLLLLTALGAARAQAAARPLWRWVAASEFYAVLPAPQQLRYAGGGTASVHPWGFGFRAVGSEAFSKTGGLQLQSVKAPKAGGGDTFYMLDLLLGMGYITPKAAGRPLRFTAAGFADLGLSDTNFYAAPVISAGLLYTTDQQADTPTGITLDIYYRCPVQFNLKYFFA